MLLNIYYPPVDNIIYPPGAGIILSPRVTVTRLGRILSPPDLVTLREREAAGSPCVRDWKSFKNCEIDGNTLNVLCESC